MPYSAEELNYIYDKTGGYCEYCDKKLAFKNYGMLGERGAWEVDHSNPRCRGGTDYLRNLFPACIDCNRNKGIRTGRSMRTSMSGYTRNSKGIDWGEVIAGGLALCLIYAIFRPAEPQTQVYHYPD